MPHNAPDEVAIASTRISGSIGAMSEQPILDEWLDERLGLFDLINIAGRGECCKLRQDRNPTVCGLTKKRSNMATSIPK
ncbi:hypothetical protein SLT36_25470 [Aminobacter sp. BA135]|uniref:hypothetical protein n=1 Tax=Aminobacter sp. BA135 TaxID=537596 RepID=UPI003D7ACE43